MHVRTVYMSLSAAPYKAEDEDKDDVDSFVPLENCWIIIFVISTSFGRISG